MAGGNQLPGESPRAALLGEGAFAVGGWPRDAGLNIDASSGVRGKGRAGRRGSRWPGTGEELTT